MKLIYPILISSLLLLSFKRKGNGAKWGGDLGDGMLGKYFSFDEFIRANSCTAAGFENSFTDRNIENAVLLVHYVGDPLRECLGGALTVNSWMRDDDCNEIAGGVEDSTHLNGGTFDVKYVVNGQRRNFEIVRCCLNLSLPFDRMLLEYGSDTNPKWVHLEYNSDLPPTEQRQIILRITSAGTSEWSWQKTDQIFNQ